MANFLTQAGSDLWDILRKRLPESFGYQWGVPDVPEMARPVGLARAALNAYSSLPTASAEDISKQIQGRVALSGIGPKPEKVGTQLTTTLPGNSRAGDVSSVNTTLDRIANKISGSSTTEDQARKSLNLKGPQVSSSDFIPHTTEDIARLFAARNPKTKVSYNGRSLSPDEVIPPGTGTEKPFSEYGPAELGSMSRDEFIKAMNNAVFQYEKTGKEGLQTLKNAPFRRDIAGGLMTSSDPTTGKERLLMASFRPQDLTETDTFFSPSLPGENPQQRELRQKLRDRAEKLLNGPDSIHGPKEADVKTAKDIITALDAASHNQGQLNLTRRGQDMTQFSTIRGQDINLLAHQDANAVAQARLSLDTAKFPYETGLTLAHIQSLLNPPPQIVHGTPGAETGALDRSGNYRTLITIPKPDQGDYEKNKTVMQNLAEKEYLENIKLLRDPLTSPEDKTRILQRNNELLGGLTASVAARKNPNTGLTEAEARKQLTAKGITGKTQDDWINRYKQAGAIK